jgi:hypothetical protein
LICVCSDFLFVSAEWPQWLHRQYQSSHAWLQVSYSASHCPKKFRGVKELQTQRNSNVYCKQHPSNTLPLISSLRQIYHYVGCRYKYAMAAHVLASRPMTV